MSRKRGKIEITAEHCEGVIRTLIIGLKLAGQFKDTWLHNMAEAWDDTPIPESLFNQRGNA